MVLEVEIMDLETGMFAVKSFVLRMGSQRKEKEVRADFLLWRLE